MNGNDEGDDGACTVAGEGEADEDSGPEEFGQRKTRVIKTPSYQTKRNAKNTKRPTYRSEVGAAIESEAAGSSSRIMEELRKPR